MREHLALSGSFPFWPGRSGPFASGSGLNGHCLRGEGHTAIWKHILLQYMPFLHPC